MIALQLQKMCQKDPLDNFLMLIPKVSQAKCYSFLIIPPPPPRAYFRLPTCFLLLLAMPLSHLGGWLSIIQTYYTGLNKLLDYISINVIITAVRPLCAYFGDAILTSHADPIP